MKKHSARVAPLSACNSPVLTLTKVEGNAWVGTGPCTPAGSPSYPAAWTWGCLAWGLLAPQELSLQCSCLRGWHLAAVGLP